MKINDLKIGVRLAMAFGMLTLLTVVLAAVVLVAQSRVAGEWRHFAESTLLKKNLVTAGDEALGLGMHNFKNYILRGGVYEDRFVTNMDDINASLAAYGKLEPLSAKEKELLEEARKGVESYRAELRTAVTMRVAGRSIVEVDMGTWGAHHLVLQALHGLLQETEQQTLNTSDILKKTVDASERWIVSISVLTLVLSIALTWLARSITKPLLRAIRIAARVADGDLNSPIEATSKDETGTLLNALHRMQNALRVHTSELEARVAARTSELNLSQQETAKALERTAVLLNNSGQGFLAFSGDLRVHADYSHECERIFGRSIAAIPVPTLLFPGDSEQQIYIEKNLQRVFDCADDELRRSIYLELLPTEYSWEERCYEAEYKYLGDHWMMMILTDVSDEKALQEEVQEERQRLEFIVRAMENRNDLLDTLEAWREFQTAVLPVLLDSRTADENALSSTLAEIYRQIHTYKGLFAQESLPSMPRQLHELESRLAVLRDRDEGFDLADIRQAFDQADLAGPLAGDLSLLTESLGEGYLAEGKSVTIPMALIDEMESRVAALLPADIAAMQVLLDGIRRLRYRSLHELLRPHFIPAELLAAKLERKIEPISCEGDDMLVDPRMLGAFCKSLAHVFRNCVDHGIEDADSRLAAGKPESGHIYCRIERVAGQLRLRIGDDGCGIDFERVRAKAVELGLASAEAAAGLSEQQVASLIFSDRLSTRDQITEVSGRGVGLAACLQEVERVGGAVEVVSTLGMGSEFRFSLPIAA